MPRSTHGRILLSYFRITRFFPCAILPLIVLSTAFAQQHVSPFARYSHEVWQTKDGLPQNSVNTIVQTDDGYIWFGTEEGLVRFDGVRFTAFDKRNTHAIAENNVTSLFEARDSSLWIGTSRGVLKLKHGQFTAYPVQEGTSEGAVRTITQDSAGVLWFGTNDGMWRLKGDSIVASARDMGLGYSWITRLLVDRNGTLWIGTSGGGLSRRLKGDSSAAQMYEGLCGNVITALFEDTAGDLWIGAERGGLTRIGKGGVRTYTLRGVRGAVSAVRVDHDGVVWVGAEDGTLAQFVAPDSLVYFSRGGGAITSMIEDREGNLWVGRVGGGLHRFSRGKFVTYTEVDGLVNNFVQAIWPDNHGGMWVGTMGGLSRFSGDSFTTSLTNERIPIEGITSLYTSQDGSLWIGMAEGLARIKDGSYRLVLTSEGMPKPSIRGIDEDRHGNLWLATRKGLYVSADRQHKEFRPYGDTTGDLRLPMWCIHIDRHTDELWASTVGMGLIRLSIADKQSKPTRFTTKDGLSNNIIRSIFEDDKGTLWFGTFAGGLNRFKNGKFTSYTIKNGLFDDNVFSIVEDDGHNLWMSCNRGIFRVSKQMLDDVAEGKRAGISGTSYGTADGMKTFECNGGYQLSGCRSSDGRLWFSTLQGLAVVDPRHIDVDSIPPPVVIEYAAIDKTSIDPRNEANAGPGNGELEFVYTAPSFTAPQQVRFKYRLEGFDEEWVDASNRRMAYYTNIPPGDYTFQVIAGNHDGIWNTTGASIRLHLAPHFYQTSWFYVLCALLIALVGSLGYHFYRTYKDREQTAYRLKGQLAQAELQVLKMQLQPHFLFNTLHAISSLMHKDLDAADEMMARLGDLLRYTLESDGAQEVELGQELEMLDHYLEIEHIRLADRLAVRRDIPPELLSALVPNLILQPIVENAVRYGVAPREAGGKVDIAAEQVGAAIRFTVCDDGPGLPERSREGVGFSNTRARLEQLYGAHQRFSYANRPEGGVCVTMEFPLRIQDHADQQPRPSLSIQTSDTHR